MSVTLFPCLTACLVAAVSLLTAGGVAFARAQRKIRHLTSALD
jgi:hypothetical protein